MIPSGVIHPVCMLHVVHMCFRQLWEVIRAGHMRPDPILYEVRKLRPKRGRDLLKLQSSEGRDETGAMQLLCKPVHHNKH